MEASAMNEHVLYNIRRGPHGFAIAKFDENLNLLAAYDVDPKYCSCPAGPRPTCRHRKMLPRMLSRVDTAEFYCYETNTWHMPLAATSAEAEDQAASAREAPLEGEIEEGIAAHPELTRDQVIDKLEASLVAPAGNVGSEAISLKDKIEGRDLERAIEIAASHEPPKPAPTGSIRRR
jgi:hypothetical protein